MLGHHLHHLNLFEILVPFFSHWGYLIIFSSVFLESLPLIGYISPGGISLILGGFLAKILVLNFWVAAIIAFVGALVGDLVAYGLGHAYGHRFLRQFGHYFFLKEAHLAQTERLLQTHTGKAIIFGRFSYITRSITPFLGGVSNISFRKFLIYDLVAILIWDLSYLLIGFVVGQGYAIAARYINYIMLIAIVLAVIIFYTYRLINRHHHAFRKYHVYTLIINIFSIYIFAETLDSVLERGWFYHADRLVNHLVATIWNPIAAETMLFITNLLTPLNVFLFSCLFIGYLVHKREWYYALLSFFALNLGVIGEYSLKILIGRPRPISTILQENSFSFPSGHATLIAIFSLLLFHCWRRNLKSNTEKIYFLIVCLLLMLLVGASRID